ncbi:MAG TPA: hypothetical protein VEV42_02040 [Pyrinomonadaceae bacterium]|nr:hypothetical protein [Pyrinomonadaceae bacterium]
MTLWLWIVLVSLVIYWSIFSYLLGRSRRWDVPALVFGISHMFFASVSVAAPIRSLLDPGYMGYQIGFIRFEGLAASLPAALILAWGLAAAWITVARGRGRWMMLVAVGDILFALNLGASILLDLLRGNFADTKIQGGEYFTISGSVAASIILFVVVLPFVASALWAIRRARSGGSAPPLAQERQDSHPNPEKNTKEITGLRYSGITLEAV